MTAFDRFERSIPELMTELAPLGAPDYVNDLLQRTAATRQRPAWSALERWIPMADLTGRLATAPRVPWRQVATALLIIALLAVYSWSTVVFGLRFSNLTHRGIITNGPYRWSKHPAYIAKNLSWWLISVPFIAGAGWMQAVQSCLLLTGVNLIYFLRAKTEERHLGSDPVYRDYVRFIDRYGLFASLSSRKS